MNLRYVLKHLGLLLLGLSAVLGGLAAAFFVVEAALRHDVVPAARQALFLSGVTGALGGGGLWLVARRCAPRLGRREALLLVALSWIVGAALAALPFFLWAHMPGTTAGADHPFRNFIDCYFEAMSGLTTTGASVLGDVEAVPRSLLLWRAFTQWLGGLGIVVVFVAVLPTLGVGGKRLFQVEAPGPAPEGLQPQIQQTAQVLLLIYLSLTVAEIVALWTAGMPVFDAVCHTFTTLATGGFSTRNASIAAFDSLAVEVIIIVFMISAGVNFGLYYQLARRRFTNILRDTELRVYLAFMLLGTLVVAGSLVEERIISSAGVGTEASLPAAIRHGVFQVASIQTTTGFVTADFDRWGFVPKAILVMLMFVGASAGSTGGGLKAIRVWLVLKVMLAEIERIFRPKVIRPIKIGSAAVDEELKLGSIAYVLGILLLFLVGSFLLMVFEPEGQIDFTTAATAAAATLNNIGPGLARVGAIQNFGWFSDASKATMAILMALGRLEVFAIIVLFSPRFWRGD